MTEKINKFKKHNNLTQFLSFNKNINKFKNHYDDIKNLFVNKKKLIWFLIIF